MNGLLEDALSRAKQAEALVALLKDCREFLASVEGEKSVLLQERIRYALVKHV